MYEQYRDRVAFLFVYIQEAHAEDEWPLPGNADAGIVVPQTRSVDERTEVAKRCCSAMRLTWPCVVDSADNAVDAAYAAWPERMFIVDRDGRIAYAGRLGPWGFKPNEVSRWLRRNVE